MNESDHKRALVSEINTLRGARARRIEDRWAVGVLDLIIKLPDRPLFLAEGKLVKGNLFAPTPAQFAEGQRWIAAGIQALLIGWKGREMAISPWVQQADWRECKIGPNNVSILMEYINGR